MALLGGAAGIVLANFGMRLIGLAFPNGLPSYLDLSLDLRVVVAAILVSLLAAAFFGGVAMLRTMSVQPATTLRDAGRGADAVGGRRIRNALVSAELALSVVLLVAAALLVRSDVVLEREMGIISRGVLTCRVPLSNRKYEGDRRRAFYEELFSRIRAIHGVESVGSSQGLPFGPTGGSSDHVGVVMEGASGPARESGLPAIRLEVSSGYLPTLRVPVVDGRGLLDADSNAGRGAAVVNQSFGRRYFAGRSPLGMRVRFVEDGPTASWFTIVGVVRDARQDRPPRPIDPQVYIPLAMAGQTLVVRTTLADPLAVVPQVRAIVRSMDPTLPVYLVQTLDHVIDVALWRQRLQGRVLTLFAALAMALAIVGVYGVIACAVAERTRELAVRLALGASRRQVFRFVLAQGARLVIVGVAVGIGAGLVLTRLLSSLLNGVPATDPLTFGCAAVGLGLVAMLAVATPALRATRLDPLVAMRTE